MSREDGARLVELTKTEAYLKEIRSTYTSPCYYDVSISQNRQGWVISLSLKAFEKTLTKEYRGRLYEDHVEEPRVFAACLDDEAVGWIEIGYDKWNNRMRVWEFLVAEKSRKRGIGTMLMNWAILVAREKGARMLVLETQTNNAVAIDFYLKFGFELIGLDSNAYSNDDIGKHEIRLEMGIKL